MRIISIRTMVLVGLTLLAVSPALAQPAPPPAYPTPTLAGAPPWMETWAGFGGTNNWYGGWAGFNYAPNGNAWADGILVRGEGGAGHYDYPTTNVPGGVSNVTYEEGALYLGYRKVIPGFFVSTTLT